MSNLLCFDVSGLIEADGVGDIKCRNAADAHFAAKDDARRSIQICRYEATQESEFVAAGWFQNPRGSRQNATPLARQVAVPDAIA
jgi:hypothetical protein